MSIRRRNNFLLYMFEQDVDLMEKWVLQYPNKETGGDLFGLWSGEGDNAVIHVVLGPGEACTHGEYHFYQDVNYLEKVGSLLTEDYMLGHIGEWHSHHQLQLDRPSEGDCRTIQRNFPKGSCGFFLMIANIINRDQVTFSPYVFKVISGNFRMLAGRIQVIAERSPFAMVAPIFQVINDGKETEQRKPKEKEDGKEKQVTGLHGKQANSRTRIENDRQDKTKVKNGEKSSCMSMISSLFRLVNQDKGESLLVDKDSKNVHRRNEDTGIDCTSNGRTSPETMNEPKVAQHSGLQEVSECVFHFQWYTKDWGQAILNHILNELALDIKENINMQYGENDSIQNMKMTFRHRGSTVRIYFPFNFPVMQAKMKLNTSPERTIHYSCTYVSLFRVQLFVNEIRKMLLKAF